MSKPDFVLTLEPAIPQLKNTPNGFQVFRYYWRLCWSSGAVRKFCFQSRVFDFKSQNQTDPGKIQSQSEQLGYSAQRGQVIFTVSARSSIGASRFNETVAFVEPKVLLSHSYDFRCHGDGIHPAGSWLFAHHQHSSGLSWKVHEKFSCISFSFML
ncbi:hypothetical protein AOC05_00790 [Arthrobacter alpinus]|uniref:Uncharacterized protein n=1 Tax=Arthrobacter alpinus TaxID=656366 RepID=A0A0M4QUK5_9MICC|nr:hypothetical protein AOC05_00790 [Arthrobacter alpinus]